MRTSWRPGAVASYVWALGLGFAFVAGILCWNIAGYFFQQFPSITVFGSARSKAVAFGRYYPDWFIKIYSRTLTYKIMRAIRAKLEAQAGVFTKPKNIPPENPNVTE